MICTTCLGVAGLLSALTVATHLHAQVRTIINAPPDVTPFTILSDTQLNLF